MPDEPEDEEEKTPIEEILESGIQSVTSEGNSTTFVSPGDLRKAHRDTEKGRRSRPVFSHINLRNT